MKFCQMLRTTSESLPETHLLFTLYKGMKKQLRRLQAHTREGNMQAEHQQEMSFVQALLASLRQFNDTFLEREELLVMNFEELESESRGVGDVDVCQELIRKLTDFHGEILLFMHWSMLAYTSLLKILKKHHKKTGHVVPGLERDYLASQPICSTEISSMVIQRAERAIRSLQHRYTALQGIAGPPSDTASNESTQMDFDLPAAENGPTTGGSIPVGHVDDMFNRTRVALETWEQLMSGATTPSTVLGMQFHVVGSVSSVSSKMSVQEAGHLP
ncbi:hypothetical protein BSKO_00255 [Bryopsis sp. KO-2023]|nr:hypothetical protein BSKO_00255 [Bryopsis sp. KO-2023]